MDTGYPEADSRDDFSRALRRAQMARIGSRLLGRSGDVDVMLPFDEVVAALGRRGEQTLGLGEVDLDTIVGSVDRGRGFDRYFRPTNTLSRARFERIAVMMRRGDDLPPVDLYRVGQAHFVRDGHHRVAVARQLGHRTIWAYVTEVLTEVGADLNLRLQDLPFKSHERLFYERVPLRPSARGAISVSDPWSYAMLAEAVEAWGFRVSQARRTFLSREEVAEEWLREEFVPIVRLLREADLATGGTDAETYMRLSAERYRLLRTHDWNADVIAELHARR